MELTQISYTSRIPNEPYGYEEVTVTANLDGREVLEESLAELRKKVVETLNISAKLAEQKAAVKPVPKIEEEVEEEVVEEETEEEVEVEEEVAPAKAAKGKKAKAEKVYKKKPQEYTRNNETHKEIFSNLLKTLAPDWKKTPEGKAMAKKVSLVLEGEDFLSEEGEILPTFVATAKKYLGTK